MNVLKLGRMFPDASQGDLVTLQGQFLKLDTDGEGYLTESATIKAVQTLERQPYDTVREALREVDLDSSRRVELEDFIRVCQLEPPPLAPISLSLATSN